MMTGQVNSLLAERIGDSTVNLACQSHLDHLFHIAECSLPCHGGNLSPFQLVHIYQAHIIYIYGTRFKQRFIHRVYRVDLNSVFSHNTDRCLHYIGIPNDQRTALVVYLL